jgi:transglutaminase-like putative cysteine protease
MQIRVGYELCYDCLQPTPMILMLNVHPSRVPDLLSPERMSFAPLVPAKQYLDTFGNICTWILAPSGRLTIATELLVCESGTPDVTVPDAVQQPVETLPMDVLVYLLGSRYCETDRLMDIAWSLFGNTLPEWARVQTICDYVNNRLEFGYKYADPTKSALDTFVDQRGVCRDFVHLAVTFCRCMGIPARYCTGYLSNIGVSAVDEPVDFAAWLEVYLSSGWHIFDPRHNQPRVGRILMARGRDATDVALVTSFGPCSLTRFRVITEEVVVN